MPGPALGAGAPVHHFSLVDDKAVIVVGDEAWRITDRTIDVDQSVTCAAHEMVMIVADAILVPGGGSRWFDTTNDALVGQYGKRVVDGLT